MHHHSKHVSGALKFVWHCLQEGKELEPFHIIIINTYFLMQCGAVKIVPRVQMFWSVLMTSPSFVAWKKLYFGPLTIWHQICYFAIRKFAISSKTTFQLMEVNIWAPSLQCYFGHTFHLTLLLNRPYRKFGAAHSL